jgi:acetyltransferase-like isoleucine patch superfamily enzyme
MRVIFFAVSFLFPWPIRRRLLEKLLGYTIHPTSRIGIAWVLPRRLVMEAHSTIGHLTVCKGLELLWLQHHAIVGRGNWITGFPAGHPVHFAHQEDRQPQLVLKEHSAITNRHIIDCTNSVTIGKYATFAGFRSQILTHSIDLENGRQSSAPIVIGDYCFVGTDCVLLGGSALPDYSVLGAKSLLNSRYDQNYYLYAGVPAKPIKKLSEEYRYFTRTTGYVN